MRFEWSSTSSEDLQSEWLVPTFDTVFATDLSEAGWAFTQAAWTSADVAAGARFKRTFGRQARASALIAAGL